MYMAAFLHTNERVIGAAAKKRSLPAWDASTVQVKLSPAGFGVTV